MSRSVLPVLLAALAQAGPDTANATEDPACIAIVLPSAHGIAGDAGDFSESLRELLISYLSGPSLRAVPLEARLTSQAIEEAEQSDCGHVLLTSVTRKRNEGSKLGKILQHSAGPVAYSIPYGGGVAGAAIHGVAVGGAYAISSMAETSKARDEVTLEYRVGTPSTVLQAAPQRGSAKAKTDGEDLLTPLVERAAESIAASVLGK